LASLKLHSGRSSVTVRWFHTSDLGNMGLHGFVCITDRGKGMIHRTGETRIKPISKCWWPAHWSGYGWIMERPKAGAS